MWELFNDSEWAILREMVADPSRLGDPVPVIDRTTPWGQTRREDRTDWDLWAGAVRDYVQETRWAIDRESRTPADKRADHLATAAADLALAELIAGRTAGEIPLPGPVGPNHERGWTWDGTDWVRVTISHDVPDTDPVRSVVPDSWTATQSTRRVSRSNSGRTATVITRHGRPVISAGSRRGTIGADGTRGADLPADWVESVPVDRDGRLSAIALTRLADRWAAETGAELETDLPPLIGSECMSWEQIISAGDGSPAPAVIWSNPAGPVEAALSTGHLSRCDLETDRRYRYDDMHTDPELLERDRRGELLAALTSTIQTGTVRPVKRPPVRLSLPMGSGRRSGDPLAIDPRTGAPAVRLNSRGEMVTYRAGAGDPVAVDPETGAVRLMAPGPDLAHRWIGHHYWTRPGTRATARATRPQTRPRVRPTVSGRPGPDLLAIISRLGNGAAIVHRWTDEAGTRWQTRTARAVTGTEISGTLTVTVHRTDPAGDGDTAPVRVRVYHRGRIRSAAAAVAVIERTTGQ